MRTLGKAIFFGALTTAVGFMALLLAGSRGFTQLGVLIALGISFAGIFMLTVFFLVLPRKAGTISRPSALRNSLCGVANRTALVAQTKVAKAEASRTVCTARTHQCGSKPG